MRIAWNVMRWLLQAVAARGSVSMPIEDQSIQVVRRREVGVTHLELRRADLSHAVGAKADQRIGRALVDDKVKIADRAGPIGAPVVST
jgi:hypothetical protein